mgnify:FL=1|tara:strand:+ start:208 stop:756 length:549 start_codon:yes stop_codon:yes gene_type:complete
MPVFNDFPEEGMIIGRLLAGYGELEFDLCMCVAMAYGDFDKVLKAMFLFRGESKRITEGSNIGEPIFERFGLGQMFRSAIADMHQCRKIRNQFAHCNWHDDYSGKISFVVLEEIAKNSEPAELSNLSMRHIDTVLLAEQEAYFKYVSRCLTYLNFEGQKLTGKIHSHPWTIPEKQQRPQLHL